MVRLERLLRLEHLIDVIDLRNGRVLGVRYVWLLTIKRVWVGRWVWVLMRFLALWWHGVL
jgi:hypothetical protein